MKKCPYCGGTHTKRVGGMWWCAICDLIFP